MRFAYDGAEINFASSPVPRKKRVGPIWLHESMGVDVFNRIVGVHLDGTNATDSDLQFLAGWENLQTLDLDGTAISDVGLERIGRLTKLRHLSLRDTNVSDGGLKHLESLNDLEELYISGTEVSRAGVARLMKKLPNCRFSDVLAFLDDSDGIEGLRE